MPVPFSSVLYYPTIDIKDSQWLRNALLFWDKIYTIVPISHKTPYHNKFSNEAHEMEMLLPIRISSDMEEVRDLTWVVEDFITDPATADLLFSERNARISPDKMPQKIRNLMEMIHYDKLPSILHSYLNDREPWISIPRELAGLYMTLLATKLAKTNGLGIVTESGVAERLAMAVEKGKPQGLWYDEDYRRPRRRRPSIPKDVAPGMLIDLVIETIALPRKLTARKIADFKHEHSEELGVFRREVAKIVSGIPEDPSIEALRQHVSDIYTSEIKPAVKSLKESIRLRSWESGIQGVLKASAFTVPPAALAIHAGMPSSFALLAGAGISVIATGVQMYRGWREARNNSPYSYLLSLQDVGKDHVSSDFILS